MNKARLLVKMLNAGSFMVLLTAIATTFRKVINWLKDLGKPKVVTS